MIQDNLRKFPQTFPWMLCWLEWLGQSDCGLLKWILNSVHPFKKGRNRLSTWTNSFSGHSCHGEVNHRKINDYISCGVITPTVHYQWFSGCLHWRALGLHYPIINQQGLLTRNPINSVVAQVSVMFVIHNEFQSRLYFVLLSFLNYKELLAVQCPHPGVYLWCIAP